MSIFDMDMSAGPRKVRPLQVNSNTANSPSEKHTKTASVSDMNKRVASKEGQMLSFIHSNIIILQTIMHSIETEHTKIQGHSAVFAGQSSTTIPL